MSDANHLCIYSMQKLEPSTSDPVAWLAFITGTVDNDVWRRELSGAAAAAAAASVSQVPLKACCQSLLLLQCCNAACPSNLYSFKESFSQTLSLQDSAAYLLCFVSDIIISSLPAPCKETALSLLQPDSTAAAVLLQRQ